MEALRRLLGREDGDVVRQRGVQRLGRALRAAGRPRRRRSQPGRSRGPRVGAPGDREPVPAREHGVERVAHDTFDRAQAGLARPAAEARAVVLERELERHDVTSWRAHVERRRYDLYSHEFRVATHETYARMREESPVFCQPGLDGETPIWFVTRYEDVVAC